MQSKKSWNSCIALNAKAVFPMPPVPTIEITGTLDLRNLPISSIFSFLPTNILVSPVNFGGLHEGLGSSAKMWAM